MSDTVVLGEVHEHYLPNALNVRNGTIAQCECGDRFMCVPSGLIGSKWVPSGELKTEEEVSGQTVENSGDQEESTTTEENNGSTESVQSV